MKDNLPVSERRHFEAILNAVPAAVVIVDRLTHRVAGVNSAAVDMFGIPEGSIVGMLCHEFVCPAEVDKCPVTDLGKTVLQAEREFTRPDGHKIPVLKTVATVEINGRSYLVESLTDISERKKSEDALRESEGKYRALFEESKDVAFISAPGGRFIDINHAGLDLFGYPSKDDLLTIDLQKDLYVNPEDREVFKSMLGDNGFVKDYEVQMKKKTGERLDVLVTAAAVRDTNEEIIAYRGFVRDITEHKKLEQQYLQSQKMEAVGQLAGGVAHDFNNILTAIMGCSSLLKIRTKDEAASKYADQIITLSDKAANLTQSLLAFSRKQMMNPKPTDLNEIVLATGKLLTRIIGEDIELRIEPFKGRVMASVDSGQIEHVLMNLATNARDAMPDGGMLAISTELVESEKDLPELGNRAADKMAIIKVTDTGLGMDTKTREKIFEPFFTTKEVGKGTGLGLAMVYGIINQHGGSIDVVSESQSGTTFRICLPAASSRFEEAGAVRHDSVRGGTETILLAEDDPEVRLTTKAILEEFGYKVIQAVNGEDMISKFSEHKDEIRLLVSDVVMPRKSGIEAYDEIRAIKPGIRALFTSGYTSDATRHKGLLHDGIKLVSKPLSPEKLSVLVREILDGKES